MIIEGLFKSADLGVLNLLSWDDFFLFGLHTQVENVNVFVVNLFLSYARYTIWQRRNLMQYHGRNLSIVKLYVTNLKKNVSDIFFYCKSVGCMKRFDIV